MQLRDHARGRVWMWMSQLLYQLTCRVALDGLIVLRPPRLEGALQAGVLAGESPGWFRQVTSPRLGGQPRSEGALVATQGDV